MPRPYNESQQAFADALLERLVGEQLMPRTLGVTDWDPEVPLAAIRRLMLDCNGLISIAFRRTFVEAGEIRPGSDSAEALTGAWQTSPWPHIEVAMAFQIGLPILVLREAGVLADGVLERGVTGLYLPQFDLDRSVPDSYFDNPELQQLLKRWIGQVNAVVTAKGTPPRLY